MLMVKKRQFFELYTLLLFAFFFAVPVRTLDFFSIRVSVTEKGVSLIFLIYSYFKKIFVEHHGFTVFLPSVLILCGAIAALGILSFFMAHFFNKIATSQHVALSRTDSIIGKILSVKPIYIALFLFVISFGIRMFYMVPGLLHHDSVQSAIATEETIKTGKLHGIVGYRYGYILTNVLAYIVPHAVFGINTSEFIITLATILFAALAVVMLYLFALESLNSPYAAFASGLIFSVSPIFLSVTTYAKDHALSLFLILTAAYYLIKSIKSDSTLHKILFASILGFALFVRISDVFVSIPFFALIYLYPFAVIDKENVKFVSRFNVRNLALIFIPLIIAFILFLIFQKGAVTGGLEGNKFLKPSGNWLDIIMSLFMTLTPLGFFLVVYGAYASAKEKRYFSLFLMIWMLSVFIFYSGFGTSKLRFFAPLLIPASIYMGLSLEYIRKRFSVASLFLLMLSFVLMFLLVQPSLSFRHQHALGKELALFLSNSTEADALIIDYGDLGVFYQYYANRKTIECPFLEKGQEFNASIAEIDNALKSGIPVYLNNQCFAFKEINAAELVDFFNRHYDFINIGTAMFENYEDIIKIKPYEFTISRIIPQHT